MDQTKEAFIIGPGDRILVTGAGGFIGSRLVENLLDRGFGKIRCLVRSSNRAGGLETLRNNRADGAELEIIRGNLLSPEDCRAIMRDVSVVFHLAAGRGEKSFPDAFLNSVVTTRNLLDACVRCDGLKRFVTVSSFAVYRSDRRTSRLLTESCAIETSVDGRGEPYCFAKLKQDEIVREYADNFGLPCVVVRPGYVFGPGNVGISGRVGIGTFGVFLHLGGSNRIPLTYVDNCADAIALAGLTSGVDGETFNIVDDNLPTSRQFLRQYKRNVRRFSSLYLPHACSYLLCGMFEWYSKWSNGQLPPILSRSKWHAYWKLTSYSNEKVKALLKWEPKVPMPEALARYFQSCRDGVEVA